MAQLHGIERTSGNMVGFFLCETELKHVKNVIKAGEFAVGMESHLSLSLVKKAY